MNGSMLPSSTPATLPGLHAGAVVLQGPDTAEGRTSESCKPRSLAWRCPRKSVDQLTAFLRGRRRKLSAKKLSARLHDSGLANTLAATQQFHWARGQSRPTSGRPGPTLGSPTLGSRTPPRPRRGSPVSTRPMRFAAAGRAQPGRAEARRPGPSWSEYPPDGFPGQAWPAGSGRMPLGAPVALDLQAPESADLAGPDGAVTPSRQAWMVIRW